MTLNEIQDLIKLVNRLNLAEFKMKDGEFEIAIRTKWYGKVSKEPPAHVPAVIPVSAAAPAPAAQPPADIAPRREAAADTGDSESGEKAEGGLVAIKSPIVGTFYRSPSPDKAPYVKVGDTVDVGGVVCIVEAMKLFNEIESEVSGKIVKVLVEDASPVEYDQELFLVDPKG